MVYDFFLPIFSSSNRTTHDICSFLRYGDLERYEIHFFPLNGMKSRELRGATVRKTNE